MEFDDIQGVVLAAYGHMPHARFLFWHVSADHVDSARQWISSLLPRVTSASRRPKSDKPTSALNLGFTSEGLTLLGLKTQVDSGFPREFEFGMAHGERPRVLGDTGPSDPSTWQFGGPNSDVIHGVVMLYGQSKHALEDLAAAIQPPTVGINICHQQNSDKHGVNEPFGFRDGISQPAIEGIGHQKPGQDVLKPGEFILGYVNEYGVIPPSPGVPQSYDPKNVLPNLSPGVRDFGRNGTYFVFRKLQQHVDLFWEYAEKQTLNADGTPNPEAKELFAAKMVGRFKSGAPLSLCKVDDPKLGADGDRNNDFVFMKSDPHGFGCPFGSHIRRSNPRDTMPPNEHKSVEVSNRHRIVRRGRPYKDVNSDATEEGLLFMAINADLQRQFEFIQQTWCNNGRFNGMTGSKDPIVGDNDPNESIFDVQQEPFRKRHVGLPRFVVMRGGGYFFLPGMRALAYLTSL